MVKSPSSAVLQKNAGLRVVFTLIVGAIVFATTAWGAPAAGARQAVGQAKAPAASDFIGSEACGACHEEVVKGFASNPHTRMAQTHGQNGVTCENCHGPGKEHVEGGGDTTKIFNPAKATTKEVNDKCLTCHQGRHANFERSGHGEGSVSCVGCHSIHAGKDTEKLLKASQPVLCFQCHTDIKPQFAMPFHHKVEEGLLTCSDCHNPHGTFGRKSLRASAQQDAVCTKCHTETAGPFVYEHAVVKTEGCTACHFPHGGPNPRLLNRANVNTICLQCHSPSMNFSTAEPQGPAHNQNTQYQACTVCHTNIHGSNVSEVFFNTK